MRALSYPYHVSDILPAPTQPADEPATGPHVVYYNSARPVCDAGVCAMRARIAWVDVHRNPERLAPLGLDLEDVRERLHLVEPSGQLQVGAPALPITWSLRSRWGRRLKSLSWPGLRTLTSWAYIAFARQLYR